MDSDKSKNELQDLQRTLGSYNTQTLELINLISNSHQKSSFEDGKKKQKCLKHLLPTDKVKVLETTLNIFNLQSNVKEKTDNLKQDWVHSIEQIIDESISSNNTDVLIFYLNAKGINTKTLYFSDYHDLARSIINSIIEKKFIDFVKRFGFPNVDRWYSIPKRSFKDTDLFGSLRIINPNVRLINAMNHTKTIKQFFMSNMLKNPGKCLNIIFARTFPKIDYIPKDVLKKKSIEVFQIFEKKSDSNYHLRKMTKRIDKMIEKRKTMNEMKSQKKKKGKNE